MSFYFLLMRHGAVDRNSSAVEANQKLSAKGMRETYEVARALYEHLDLHHHDEKIRIGKILYAPYRHANETAGAVFAVFGARGAPFNAAECPDLSPADFWRRQSSTGKYRPEDMPPFVRSTKALEQELPAGANALLIVGHDPQLGWIANHLLRANSFGRRARALPPPARSEVLCLRCEHVEKAAEFLWSISPADPDTLAALKEKIKSKMTTAGQLSAFITALLGISLGLLADPDKLDKFCKSNPIIVSHLRIGNGSGLLAPLSTAVAANVLLIVSAVSLFGAMGLYLAAMYAYDTLLMPTRFWRGSPEKPPRWVPRRPPSSQIWVLYVNMIAVWRWMFTPATVLVAVGLLAFAELVFKVHPAEFVPAALLSAAAFRGYTRWRRPRLGTQD